MTLTTGLLLLACGFIAFIAIGAPVCYWLALRNAISIERGAKTPTSPKVRPGAYWH